MTSSAVSFLAPAKINIRLEVFNRRPDGLHAIRSVMVPVSLYDEVVVETADSGVSVVSDDPAVPSDGTDTCSRAARAFMAWAGAPPGVRITLRKRIPAEAGLGGGSSDAAAVLKGLMALTGTTPPRETLLSMASGVGADVPFFFAGGAALVEGAGETVTPLPWTVPFHAVIVKPAVGLPTREGYARLKRPTGESPAPAPLPGLSTFAELCAAVSNDFEEGWETAVPEIGAIKQELLDAGAKAAGLSGSGSAVFGLYGKEEEACRALATLRKGRDRRLYLARNV